METTGEIIYQVLCEFVRGDPYAGDTCVCIMC